MENLEALDGRFVVLWDSSAVRIHESALVRFEPRTYQSRAGAPKRQITEPEPLNDRPLSRHPTVLTIDERSLSIVDRLKLDINTMDAGSVVYRLRAPARDW